MIVVEDMMTIVEVVEGAGTMTVAVSVDLVVAVNYFSGETISSHSIHLACALSRSLLLLRIFWRWRLWRVLN